MRVEYPARDKHGRYPTDERAPQNHRWISLRSQTGTCLSGLPEGDEDTRVPGAKGAHLGAYGRVGMSVVMSAQLSATATGPAPLVCEKWAARRALLQTVRSTILAQKHKPVKTVCFLLPPY